jgi:hypothetical protein
MATRNRPVGLNHPTVVPTNFEREAAGEQPASESGGTDKSGETAADGTA